LLKAENIRMNGPTALPTGNKNSIQDTEKVFGLMVHMSTSLGVNCAYCHNTRSMPEWSQSPPQRMTAWYGIRMVRDLNNNYMVPLTGVFPAHRLGPEGDVLKNNCTTCHQGAYKPLYGVSMLKDYPFLTGTPAPRVAPKPGEKSNTVAMK
jgi:photosynthetic reaction center cytochrome c subunit